MSDRRLESEGHHSSLLEERAGAAPLIQIVEDESAISKLVERLLKSAGFRVQSALTGVDAQLQVTRTKPDLVLLDLSLPDVDGFVLYELLRSQRGMDEVPIILLTGNQSVEQKVRAFELGAIDYITKPFNHEELLARVRSHLGQYFQNNEMKKAASLAAKEAQDAAREAEYRIQALVQNSFDLVSEVDESLNIIYASPNHREILEYDPETLLGKCWLDYVHEEERLNLGEMLLSGMEDSLQKRWMHRMRNSAGEWRWFDTSCSRLEQVREANHILLISRDVTERKRTEEHLHYMALHDSLTGLGNRQYFSNELERIVKDVNVSNVAVLYLDLDNFKVINDSEGHLVGDEVLRACARMLREIVGPGHVISRFGGDEFCVILFEVDEESAKRYGDMLVEAFERQPWVTTYGGVPITISIGIAMLEPGIEGVEVLSRADSALYAAKSSGKNRAALFRLEDEGFFRLRTEADWSRRILEGIQNGNFQLWYQPIFRVDNEEIFCYEALIRYRDDEGTIHFPRAFLPAAERFNLIKRLDQHVLELACADLIRFPDRCISINVSGDSISSEDFIAYFENKVGESGIEPERLIVEITETAFISNLNHANHLVKHLQEQGYQFAIDDFGAGFSSLSYLRYLSVDFLKIDGSFVEGLSKDPVKYAILRSINNIAHALGKKTITEYVDSAETVECLKQLDVDYAQGFFLGKPVPFETNS